VIVGKKGKLTIRMPLVTQWRQVQLGIFVEPIGEELVLPPLISTSSRESDKMPGVYLLNDLVDLSTLECLNQDDTHPVTNVLKKCRYDGTESERTALQSDPDVDHQLLIKVGFIQPVKLKALAFRGKAEDETAPQVGKIFHGQKDIGFQEAEDQEANQTLELSATQVNDCDPVGLRFVKFQNVYLAMERAIGDTDGAGILPLLTEDPDVWPYELRDIVASRHNFNAEECDCFHPQDKRRILAVITQGNDGLTNFNAKVSKLLSKIGEQCSPESGNVLIVGGAVEMRSDRRPKSRGRQLVLLYLRLYR